MNEGIECAAFMGGQGAKARSIAYCNDGTTPTLKSVPSGGNTVPDVVIKMGDRVKCITPWDIQSRRVYQTNGVWMPLYAGEGGGKGTLCYEISAGTIRLGNNKVCQTLRSRMGTGGGNIPIIQSENTKNKYVLRRLTPTECARLQGFPDWWCDGAEGSDSAQYKLWGNGIALPCAYDVLGRIAKAYSQEGTGRP